MWAVLRKIMFLYSGLYAYPEETREQANAVSRVEIRTQRMCVTPLGCDPL